MLASTTAAIIRHRKPLAVIGSVGPHVVLAWLFLMPASAPMAELDKPASGALIGEGIDVDLVPPAPDSAPPMPAPATQPPQTRALDAFTALSQPTPSATTAVLSAPSPTQSLSEVFGKDVFAPSLTEPQHAQTQHSPVQTAQVKIANTADRPTPNNLWKAIEPCWRRLVTRDTRAVTLSVSFSPLGNLAKAPVVVRATAGRPDDWQLKSEALAVDALAQCGPYLMAFGQDDVSVQFPAGR